MRLWIDQKGQSITSIEIALQHFIIELTKLGFTASIIAEGRKSTKKMGILITTEGDQSKNKNSNKLIELNTKITLVEQTLRLFPIHFDTLPLYHEGESKEIRSWTDQVLVMRFKPTVYSYTHNRYGTVPGTDHSRIKFTSALFREMKEMHKEYPNLDNAFIAELPSEHDPMIVQKKVKTSNLEIRVKRFHIGSPVHRYRYTEKYETTQKCGPLTRWSLLDEPVVCFDWRNPLHDDHGQRLADEPISDDYAKIWMANVEGGKTLARQTFLWLEKRFKTAGIRLVDICFLIDYYGKTLYGEISPDCMRVQLDMQDVENADAGAKDVWRMGGSPNQLYQNYEYLYHRIFTR